MGAFNEEEEDEDDMSEENSNNNNNTNTSNNTSNNTNNNNNNATINLENINDSLNRRTSLNGGAQLLSDEKDTSLTVKTFTTGDYFGEQALVAPDCVRR